MTKTPLWTQSELASAFALLLPPALAAELATDWFATFASEPGDLDEHGHFVFDGTWGEPPAGQHEGDGGDLPEWHTPERVRQDEALFATWTETEATAWLGPRLGDIHLALVALLNDDLFERMRTARLMSRQAASRNCLQLTRAVRAYRRAQGWPPAV